MRIVITGASGNVGTALLRRLAADGEHEVVGLARRPPTGGFPYAYAQWVAADLADPTSGTALQLAMRGADAVVHLAWGFQPSHDIGYLQALGVGGTGRVLAAADAAGVPHLVHMSSVGAYSPKANDRPVDESWQTGGVPSSPYSRHKVAAERLLDAYERDTTSSRVLVTRLRPGIVGQRAAGSALLRYGVPALVPSGALRTVPVLPLDRKLMIPMVHADDVTDAIVRVLESRAPGAFNLAASTPVTTAMIAAALGAVHVQVPGAAVRALVNAAWQARLQAVDPGWLDLAYAAPLLDIGRAWLDLGWVPSVDGEVVLRETVAGMSEAAWSPSMALRQRTVLQQVKQLLSEGPVSHRRLADKERRPVDA